MKLERPRLDALTSLRFFAALIILLFHMGLWTIPWLPDWAKHVSTLGYVAVSFFFLLSGFILVYTYGGKPFDLRSFWKARLSRLYPVYLLSLIVSFLFIANMMQWPENILLVKHPVWMSVLTLGLQQAWIPDAALIWNGVAWAVSVEIFFYVVFPWLLKRFERIDPSRAVRLGGKIWLLAPVLAALYAWISPDHVNASLFEENHFWLKMLKFNPLVHLPEFILGMACGIWFLSNSDRRYLSAPLCAGGIGLTLIGVCLSPTIPYPMLHTGLFAPPFAMIICGVALRPQRSGFLESRWLVLFGESSYCLYLFQFSVLSCLYWQPGVPSLWKMALAVGVSVLVGLVVHILIEEPIRKWLREMQTMPHGSSDSKTSEPPMSSLSHDPAAQES